jgi:hypothetical protein
MSIGQIVAVPWTLGGAALCDGADPLRPVDAG